MPRMLFSVLISACVASMVLFVAGWISNYLDPTPIELMDSSSAENVEERVLQTSFAKWLSVILGISIGALIGTRTFYRICGKQYQQIGFYILLFVLSLWSFYTFYIVYPNELWVPLCMLLGTLLFAFWSKRRNE